MLIWTDKACDNVLEWLNKQNEVFYDIETDSLDQRGGTIIGIGISNYFTGYYLPLHVFDLPSNSLKVVDGAHRRAQTLLKALKSKKVCAFNGAFDLPFTTYNLGVDLLPNYHCDVLLLKHTVDEEFPFKLKEIAVQIFGYGAASEQRDLQAELKALGAPKGEIYKAKPETIGKYCVQDCLLTARLYKHYSAKLKEQNLEQFFYVDEVMPLYKHVTIPMEQYGVAIDLPLMQSTLTEISVDIEAIEAKIQAAIKPILGKFEGWFLNKDYPPSRAGNFAQAYAKLNNLDLPLTDSGKFSLTAKNLSKLPDSHAKQVLLKAELMTDEEILQTQLYLAEQDHGAIPLFNLQSKHHLKKLFFDTLGLTPLSTTDLGNPQVDDEFIHSISGQYSWAMDLHVYNKLQKIRSTYIERFLDKQKDGVFYPSFFQHRTVSGRLAGDFQQLPRPIENAEHELVEKYTNLIRKFFIARPGKILVDADYNSAEPRVFAFISGDAGLKSIFQNNMDFYSHIAIMTEKLTQYSATKSDPNYLGKLNPAKRQSAKGYALGTPYGLTGYKLAFELNCTSEEGDQLIENYLNAFPGLRNWMQNTQKLVMEQGYIRTLGGRIRHLGRAKLIAARHGTNILDSLWLYKEYGNQPGLYEEMKKLRKEFKNLINNANNVQIQAVVASIINRASIQIALEFIQKDVDAHISAQIHDQLVIEASEAHKDVAAEIVQRNMESAVKLFVTDVPIPAEPNFGHNLKESKGA